jgi:hypothetical protein
VDDKGLGIYDARVTCDGASRYTGALGEFRLPDLPKTGLIAVGARGFLPRIVPLGSDPGGPLIVELTPIRTVRLLVLDGLTSLPLAKAHVASRGPARIERRTNDFGEVELTVGREPLTLQVWHPGRVATVWREERDPPLIVLEAGRGVRGRILRPDGLPAIAAEVVVVGKTQEQWPQSVPRKTDADGWFQLPSGIKFDEPFAVFAWTEAFATPLKPDWRPPGYDHVEVQLDRRGALEVYGAGGPKPGTPLRPAPKAAFDPNPGVRARRYTGHALFTGLAAGAYVLRSPSGQGHGAAYTVRPGESTRVDWGTEAPHDSALKTRRVKDRDAPPAPPAVAVSTPPSSTLRVRVEPPAAVEVVLRDPDGAQVLRAKTRADGRAALMGLPPGDYVVEVTRGEDKLEEPLTLPQASEVLLALPGGRASR